ncbi:signal recognition particle receptor FtsY [Nocardia neocaledoniensis NBRC 108232]|uniref:Signal recognition particle receptor FtsY n=1 Tax=Nocardia neocaledoniensis TaxID=236511 RepID=A0A317P0R9_9NOCA|nr:signal recognition particle-docking protein FtsY [Nocardia neocaledoniensis]PWV81366.1 signal recognition particle-docking protein FtsY [Nocardia neocaledoniensis]GEM34903.1 signal recognition particle receptor FtsY [Nocardia neocaledoniensis NBRC 108232]
MSSQAWILIAAIAAVVLVALVAGFVLYKRRQISLAPPEPDKELTDRSGGYTASGGFSFSQGGSAATVPRPDPVVERTDDEGQPHVGDDAAVPRDAPRRGITDVPLPEADVQGAEPLVVPDDLSSLDTTETAPTDTAPTDTAPTDTAPEPAPTDTAPADTAPTEPAPADTAPAETAPTEADAVATEIEHIDPTTGRLERLRGRLSRSQNAVGKSLLGLLGGGDLDEDSWEEIEDTLVLADIGTASTAKIVGRLREEMASRSVRTPEQARTTLRDVLIEALRPELDRSIHALPHADHPAILLVVGVNGTGKTTTTGKLARVLVADGRRVLLGAADTFRAAAADQLQTWGERVGAETVRGKEAADPAAVAFDAVTAGIDRGVDAVLIDTAGRLHTKTGLMDELGKVKRVVEKKAEVDEVLLVLDSTVGQNGLMQARVFADVVDITGVVLTKLDGTAKGGIVFQVQHELGVPVKLVGLGEGADDLAPFEPGAFVDALLGGTQQ